MITRINEKWDPISWGWLSQNTFHTTSTVLVMVEPLVEFLIWAYKIYFDNQVCLSVTKNQLHPINKGY